MLSNDTSETVRARIGAAALACACLLAGCAAPEPPTVSVVELSQRPAEHALLEGMRKYESGAFDQAEGSFKVALHEGLADRRDRAVAYKYLAFIACAFARLDECEANFRSAFSSDPGFRLTDAEIGHPIWGPVYKRVAAAQPPSR
jgi:Tfp pilus assembly protein PilF